MGNSGVTDAITFGTVLAILIVLNLVVPMIYSTPTYLNPGSTSNNLSRIDTDSQSLNAASGLADTPSAWDILGGLIGAVWSIFIFGLKVIFYNPNLPLWLNVIFLTPLRGVMILIIVKHLPVIGSGG